MRGEISDGMILAEDEVGLGGEHSGIMLLPETEPGTPLGDVLPLVDHVLHRRGDREPARPAVRLRPRPRDRDPLRPVPHGPVGGLSPDTPRADGRDPDRRLRRLPALRRPAVRERRDRPVAAVAADAALPGRPAADLERRRRHQLRDARARQPAARVRLHRAARRPDHRPARRRRREADDARQRRPRAHRRRSRDRRRRPRRRARRDHGRRGDRDRRGDDHGAARGRELRAVRHLPHLRAPEAPHRGLEPLGEGRRPLPRRAGRGRRDRGSCSRPRAAPGPPTAT